MSETETDAATTTDPKSAPIDELADRYQKLLDARAAQAQGKADEDEAKAEISELLATHGATIGLINGKPVLELRSATKSNPPALGKLDLVAHDMAIRVVSMFGALLGIPEDRTGPVEDAVEKVARKVLADYTTISRFTMFETKKFLPKQGKR